MKYKIIRTSIVYENGLKDTMDNEFETNNLESERKRLSEEFNCKYVYFTFTQNKPTIKFETNNSFNEIICNEFEVSIDCMETKSRKRVDVEVRQFAMWYRHDVLGESTTHVGSLYGKDHATVLYAKNTVKSLIETDREFRRKAEKAIAALETIKN